VRRLLTAAVLAFGTAAPAHAAPFTVGAGQNGGVAIDDGGTAYVGWQVNVGAPGDALQLCVLPPHGTRCAASTTVGFPGSGYNRSRVSVLTPAPNTVDLAVARTNIGAGDADTYRARSTDGGRTFGPASKIADAGLAQGVLASNGRIAMSDGPTTLHAGVFPLDGSGAGGRGALLVPFLEGAFNDVASAGDEVLVASSDADGANAFRLPAGGNANDAAVWQSIPGLAPGRQPQLAGGPRGFVALLEPPGDSPPGLFVQRLEPAGWAPPISIASELNNVEFQLHQNTRGRLTALITYSGYRLDYATSTDGGVLWSSLVTVARYGEPYPSHLEFATNAAGRGVAVVDNSLGDKAVRVARFSPRAAPTARRRLGNARVQARSVCEGDTMSVVVEAARGDRQVAPGVVLRRASFGRARGARRRFAGRWRARYDVRRRARIPVRVTPRSGKRRTLRLPVRRCGATR